MSGFLVDFKPVADYTSQIQADGSYTDTYVCQACGNSGHPSYYVNASGTYEAVSTNYLAYFRRISNLCITSDTIVSLVWDAFSLVGNRFMLYANASLLHDTGCVTGSSSTTVTLPAGTNEIWVYVYGACNTTGTDLWSYQVS